MSAKQLTKEHIKNLRTEQERLKEVWRRVKHIYKTHRARYKNKTDILIEAIDLLEERLSKALS